MQLGALEIGGSIDPGKSAGRHPRGVSLVDFSVTWLWELHDPGHTGKTLQMIRHLLILTAGHAEFLHLSVEGHVWHAVPVNSKMWQNLGGKIR